MHAILWSQKHGPCTANGSQPHLAPHELQPENPCPTPKATALWP